MMMLLLRRCRHPPPVPVLHEDEATIEGESLLVHSETVEQVVEPACTAS
jgi:hypothetical protein